MNKNILMQGGLALMLLLAAPSAAQERVEVVL